MERTISVEERIKRAEDIYSRRNGIQHLRSEAQTKETKKRNKRKLIKQICFCLTIYIVFYTISNREHIFSEEFRNEVATFFTEKTEINNWYEKSKSYILEKIGLNEEKLENVENKEEKKEQNEEQSEPKEQNEPKIEEKKEEENQNPVEENIGGAEQKEDEQTEAEEIKQKISFIKPVEGRISSTFGWRNPTTKTVPKYHTGIDIATNEGTVIKSATDGKVILASSKGDYGNHYKIQIEDVILIYAHCKKLYLNEGEEVKQGQEIAEVGSTGNSTGPHLHFEIRKGQETVSLIDPQLVLDF